MYVAKGQFKLSILDAEKAIFDGFASNLFLRGDKTEYEILPQHYPLLGVLGQGKIVIDWKQYVPIKKGVVSFDRNECTIIVEEDKI